MIKNKLLVAKVALFSVVLPFIYGCQGGGGGSSSSLLGGGGSAGLSGGGDGGAGSGVLLSGGGGGETIVNPEPASMLLFGTGMAAMAMWKHKTTKK